MPLQLVIVTPSAPVVDTEADTVVCPGSEGEFGVLPDHEPFLAPLEEGAVVYQTAGRSHRIEITGGFAEVTAERVTVLADAVRDEGEQAT